MSRSAPTALLLAAGPASPGAAALLERLRALADAGQAARVLLSGDGLGWAEEGGLALLVEVLDVAVCSRNARAAGWTLDTTPDGVRWSSVGTWLAEVDAEGPAVLWTALP